MPNGNSRRRPQRLHHDQHDPVVVNLETYERRLEVVLRITRLTVKILASITIPILTGLSSLHHLF